MAGCRSRPDGRSSPAAGGSLGLHFGAEASQKTTTGIQNFNRENPPYATSTRWRVEESRVDLVAVTTFGTAGTGSAVQRMRARFDPALVGGLQWWLDADPTTTTAGTNRDRRVYTDTPPATTVNYLPWAKPYIDKSNFATSLANQTREAALTHPIFLRGVSQFIVEFAGDFFDQGNIDAAGTPEGLGTIDYVPLPGGGSQVRWYGMPRDSNGDAVVGAFDVQPVSIPPPPSPFGGSGVASRFNVAATPPAVIPGATGMQKPRSTGTLPYIFAGAR